MKTAAEINAEHIAAIIDKYGASTPRAIARKIVEAFPELQPPQFTSERDGTSRIIVHPLPWTRP